MTPDPLCSPDPAVRLTALQTIAADPGALDPARIPALLALAAQEENPLVRRLLVAILACSEGAEVDAFLADEAGRCTDDSVVLALGWRLAHAPLPILPRLVELMFEGHREAAQLAAARALKAVGGLPEAVQLRRDLLLDDDGEWLLYHDAPEAWREEVQGPLAERAWYRIDRPLALWDVWDGLNDTARLQLVRRTAQQAPRELVRFAEVAPEEVSDAVAAEALEWGRQAGVDWPEVAGAFSARSDPRLRAAVIASGGLDDQVHVLAQQAAQDPTVRVAAVRRWAVLEGPHGLEDLRQDRHWAVRAAVDEAFESAQA